MRLDRFDNPIFEEEEVLDYIYENPDRVDDINFQDLITENTASKASTLIADTFTKKDYDETIQQNFLLENNLSLVYDFSTNAYLQLKDRIFAMASTSEEAGRIEIEFREFEKRKMQKMLLMLNAMITQMRLNDIVWGVGRGSSVASYVLYLIGVHKIDSLKYNLDHREFFK